jgi:hypothetical protein
MARSMMNEKNIGQTYWVEAIHTTIHILNKSHLRPHSDKTPYELWYGRLASIKHFKGFKKGMVDNNIYINYEGDDLLVVLVYVDDIIFGCTIDPSLQWFANSMQTEFEMSMIGELSYFLGL